MNKARVRRQPVQDRLIWQICRFYLDGKFSWRALDDTDRAYLLSLLKTDMGLVNAFDLVLDNPKIKHSTIAIREIKKRVPFFFED